MMFGDFCDGGYCQILAIFSIFLSFFFLSISSIFYSVFYAVSPRLVPDLDPI